MAMGAAQARGIPSSIILLYKTDSQFRDSDKIDVDHFVGFNIRGASQIRFTTYDELTTQLTKKLEKMLWSLNLEFVHFLMKDVSSSF